MRYIDIKRSVAADIWAYENGRYTVTECLKQIDRDIHINTDCIPNIDTRIEQQNKLYIYGLEKLVKSIKTMERRK